MFQGSHASLETQSKEKVWGADPIQFVLAVLGLLNSFPEREGDFKVRKLHRSNVERRICLPEATYIFC